MLDRRVTYKRRHSYNTKSNGVKIIKTPGGKLTVQYRKKFGKSPKCGQAGCNITLAGIPHLRPKEKTQVSKRVKTVTRAYGGVLCSPCVREKIIRAFLIEEQKNVKKVIKAKESAKKEEKKKDVKKPAAKKGKGKARGKK